MFLSAYAQAGAPGTLSFWLGAFDCDAAPDAGALAVTVNGVAAHGTVLAGFKPIRDGYARNWHARLAIDGPLPPAELRIGFRLGQATVELTLRPLPAALPEPADASFTILLSSCFYQPNDRRRDNDPVGLLSRVVRRLPRPDLTVLAGDQVYLDLPVTQNLPQKQPALSQALAGKYRRNFAHNPAAGAHGALGELLTRAPVVCLPDDHEFWNNYPYPQAQLPDTWTDGGKGRDRWRDAARALYQDYQCAPGQDCAFARRLDVEPLKLLFLDLRSARGEAQPPPKPGKPPPEDLMPQVAVDALRAWRKDLLDARKAGRPCYGVLSSGQILFLPRPDWAHRQLVDAEMANYAQYAIVHEVLDDLARAGVPVVYISGDVHWGRVSSARYRGSDGASPDGGLLLHEVIASPSTLIDNPGDGAKRAWAGVRDWFGPPDPWPTHSPTPKPPPDFGPPQAPKRFAVQRVFPREDGTCLGNHVALLRFSRSAGGVKLAITYHPITDDSRPPLSIGPVEIQLPAA